MILSCAFKVWRSFVHRAVRSVALTLKTDYVEISIISLHHPKLKSVSRNTLHHYAACCKVCVWKALSPDSYGHTLRKLPPSASLGSNLSLQRISSSSIIHLFSLFVNRKVYIFSALKCRIITIYHYAFLCIMHKLSLFFHFYPQNTQFYSRFI